MQVKYLGVKVTLCLQLTFKWFSKKLYICTNMCLCVYIYVCVCVCVCMCVAQLLQLFVASWTVACQAPLSMEFSGQEYCNG